MFMCMRGVGAMWQLDGVAVLVVGKDTRMGYPGYYIDYGPNSSKKKKQRRWRTNKLVRTFLYTPHFFRFKLGIDLDRCIHTLFNIITP